MPLCPPTRIAFKGRHQAPSEGGQALPRPAAGGRKPRYEPTRNQKSQVLQAAAFVTAAELEQVVCIVCVFAVIALHWDVWRVWGGSSGSAVALEETR